MASLFDALWTAVQPAFDSVLGEPITVEPKAAGNSASGIGPMRADPALPPFMATGIFRARTVVDRPPAAGTRKSVLPDLLLDKATADFAVAQFIPATMPRQDWTLVLSSRPGAPRWRIDSVEQDAVARILCILAPMGNSV